MRDFLTEVNNFAYGDSANKNHTGVKYKDYDDRERRVIEFVITSSLWHGKQTTSTG